LFVNTDAVNVCVAPSGFVAVSGVIVMYESTQVLLASLEPPAVVFVDVLDARVIVCPLTFNVVVTWTTVTPGVLAEEITTLQLAAASV
jgi:hypothetical protein